MYFGGEHMKNKNEYIDDEVFIKEDTKLDQIKKTYLIMNDFWDTIDKSLKKNINSLIRFVAKYRSLNTKALITPYPTVGLPWTPACERIIYESAGVNKDKFVEDVLTIRGWEGYIDKYLKDKAPYILLLLIARWCMIEKRERELNIVCHYIGYSYYWQVFSLHFRLYRIDENIMRYTIEEMSYKSKLKSLGSIDEWLYDGVMNALESYKERLMRASDYELHYINEKIKAKFATAMKTIHSAQKKNTDEKNYIFLSSAFGNDDNIAENTYGSTEVVASADSFANKFFQEPINEEALKASLIPGGITEKDLRTVILKIADNKENMNDVRRLYQSFFLLFLEDQKYQVRDIGTLKFYFEMKKLYKPGNSNDPNKLAIKEILDKWLKMGSATFRNTNRTPTITTFRKSIYEYFIIKIMKDK